MLSGRLSVSSASLKCGHTLHRHLALGHLPAYMWASFGVFILFPIQPLKRCFPLNLGPHLWYAEPRNSHTHCTFNITRRPYSKNQLVWWGDACVCFCVCSPCSAVYAQRLACFCASIQLALLWAAVLIAVWMVSAKCFVTVWKHERREGRTRKGISLFLFCFSSLLMAQRNALGFNLQLPCNPFPLPHERVSSPNQE